MNSYQTDASGKWIYKDPNAVLDYSIDWSDWLDDDTIATSTWIVSGGMTAGATTNTDTVATVWLSGGTVSTVYAVTNRIVTDGGRTEDRSFRVVVKER